MSTEFLKQHAQTLSEFARLTSLRAERSPDDFWLNLAAKNQKQAAQSVTQDLKIAYAEEAGELLDLRFIGPKAEGSILLDAFIKIAGPLSQAWKSAAYRLRHGVAEGRIGSEISDSLNLKLAGMAYGSTRIFLTGNAMEDLSGENLLQATLTQTFKLLNARNEDFYEAIDAIGGRSAQHFGEAMKAIDTAGLAAEFSWLSPLGRLTWHGNSDEVVRIRSLLEAIKEPDRYEEQIKGTVSGITDTGRLEMRTEDGKVHIRFPLDLTKAVQHLTIAKPAGINVKTARYWDAINKKDVYKRIMTGLIESNSTNNKVDPKLL